MFRKILNFFKKKLKPVKSSVTHIYVEDKNKNNKASVTTKQDTVVFPTTPNSYVLLEELGRGSFGRVYKAICTDLTKYVAIKVINADKTNLTDTERETRLMKLVSHPNILSMHACFIADHCVWLVLPYMDGGSVASILEKHYPNGIRNEQVIASILHGVLTGLSYMHGQGVIHRDIKAENVLLSSDGSVMLGDFGAAVCVYDNGDRSGLRRHTITGTVDFMAPEVVIREPKGYGYEADVWSVGIMAVEIATGMSPYHRLNRPQVVNRLKRKMVPKFDLHGFSPLLYDFVSSCLRTDPVKRPSVAKLLEHRFISEFAEDKEFLGRRFLKVLPACVVPRDPISHPHFTIEDDDGSDGEGNDEGCIFEMSV